MAVRVLRRCAAVHMTVLVDPDEIAEEEARDARGGVFDRIDGCVADRVIGLRPVCVALDLRDVDVRVDGDRAGAGDRVDDVPVSDGRGLDVRIVRLQLVEHRRPFVVRPRGEDVVDHAGPFAPHTGQDGRPRRVGNGGVPDDARRGSGAVIHQGEEVRRFSSSARILLKFVPSTPITSTFGCGIRKQRVWCAIELSDGVLRCRGGGAAEGALNFISYRGQHPHQQRCRERRPRARTHEWLQHRSHKVRDDTDDGGALLRRYRRGGSPRRPAAVNVVAAVVNARSRGTSETRSRLRSGVGGIRSRRRTRSTADVILLRPSGRGSSPCRVGPASLAPGGLGLLLGSVSSSAGAPRPVG